jgi:hypothetical protein
MLEFPPTRVAEIGVRKVGEVLDWKDEVDIRRIVRRLVQHIDAPVDAPVLRPCQVRAAECLLRKLVPDLRAIEITGDIGPPRLIIDMRAGVEEARRELVINHDAPAKALSDIVLLREQPELRVRTAVPLPPPRGPIKGRTGRPKTYAEGWEARRKRLRAEKRAARAAALAALDAKA